MDLYDRILGSLACAAMGDALGAPTEAMSRNEILERWGGYVTTFVKPDPESVFAGGNEAGEVTDDATQMYEMAKAIVAENGDLTVAGAAQAIVNWSGYGKYYPRNAGPTTRFVVEELKRGADPLVTGMTGGFYGRGTSNGSAMRVAAAGLVNPGNVEEAINTAIVTCLPSHATQIGMAGACAIAAGIAAAMTDDADVFSVVRACICGARQGEQYGRTHCRVAPGASVAHRIGLALRVAAEADTLDDALEAIEAHVGNECDINASVPAAIGLFAYAQGDPMTTIIGGANVGNDTDSIACIAGSIAGAMSGFGSIPSDMYAQLRRANPEIDLETVARQLSEIAARRMSIGSRA